MLHYLMYIYIYKSRLYIHPWSLTTTHHDYCATSFTSPRCPTSAENHWGGKQLEIKQLGDCDFYQFLGDIYIHWCVYIHIYIYTIHFFKWICSFINISRPWGHVFLNTLGVLLLKQFCTCLPLEKYFFLAKVKAWIWLSFSWSLIVMAFSRNCSWRQVTLTV